MVAPQAFIGILTSTGARAIGVLRAAQHAAKRLLRRPRHQTVEIRSVSAAASIGATGHVTATAIRWRPDAPVLEQIAMVRDEIADVRKTVSSVEKAVNLERQQRAAAVAAVEATVATKVVELHDRIDAQEAQSQELDTRGLPPIAVGIVLSGVPDELAHFTWLGWLLLAAALWLTLRGCQQVYRHRRSAGVLG